MSTDNEQPELSTQLLVGDRWVEGEAEPIDLFRPATGDLLARMAQASPQQVDAAVAAAQAAAASWARVTPGERAHQLLGIADALEARAPELADLESANCGKPRQRMLEDETHHIVDPFRFFAGALRCLQGPLSGEFVGGHTSLVRRDPVGVVGLITPWNYPAMMAAWKLAPALAAGNTVVIKPSEETPLSTIALVKVLADRLPPGVVNLVYGAGETVGAQLVAHPDVGMVSLTGDVSTGQAVARSAADGLKRVHLELGGKAPVLVYADADIDALVSTLRMAGYYNAGQDCTAACRVFAQASVYDRVLEGLTEAARSLKMGDPSDDATELGPLISAPHRARVAAFVERARSLDHVAITTGGERGEGPGFYYQPTVVAHARPGDEIVEREVFGPVVSLTRFDDEARMLTHANDTRYGLAASVWTRDGGRALEVSSRLEYGCVWVNQHLVWPSEMPHGGLKMSGVGKEMSVYGLEDYTVVRHIMLKH